MLYLTGDTHGEIMRFKHNGLRKIKKNDTLIVCGDFGFVWGEQDKAMSAALKWLGKRKYNIVFVDGVHENFELLNNYEIEEWQGGRTRRISGRLRMLMRGEVFNIDGKRILAFGGGHNEPVPLDDSIPARREEDGFAQPDVTCYAPAQADYENALHNLERVGNKVDYIVSHEPPTLISGALSMNKRVSDSSAYYLDEISKKAEYRRWFFGKHHVNKVIPPKFFALFDDIINAEYELSKKEK